MRRYSVTLPAVFMILLSTIAFIVPTSTAFKGGEGSPKSNSLISRNVQVWKYTTYFPRWLDMSSDGKYVVAGSILEAQLLNETGNVLWKFALGDTPLKSASLGWVRISDDGKYVAFGGSHRVDTKVRGFVFFFDRMGHVWNKTDFTGGVDTGSISGYGSRLVVAVGNRVEVFDKAGVLKWGYNVTVTGAVHSVSISFDGDYVAVGWTPEPGGVCLLYEGYLVWEHDFGWYHDLRPVRISKDGKYVIAIDWAWVSKKTNVLYYNQTGALLWSQPIEYMSGYYYGAAISYDGEYAVACGNTTIYFFDKTGLQWSYNTGEELTSIDISSDGNFIVASSHQGKKVFHLNKYKTLIWEISLTEIAAYPGPVAISGNGEYFTTTDTTGGHVYLYFSKKYFNYRFVTPDAEPIRNLDLKWYFANGTLYTSMLTNATGWIKFFDPYFLDYSTVAYYWGTKVGSYALVKKGVPPFLKEPLYETTIDQVASLFDWDIYIRDPEGAPLKARVETYLWNNTLYDNRTTDHLRFENMPNQTYTFKVYYPGVPMVERKIALTQDEQTSTITVVLPVLDITVTASPVTIYSGGTSTIKVSVTSLGTAVAGATVSLTSDKGGTFSAVTDHANGTYTATFTAPDVTTQTTCTITAAVSKSGYTSGSGQTQVTVQPLVLNVYVKDADGKPIAGATVVSTSQPSGQTALSGTTDANGLASFTGILKGSYTIKASKAGYEDKTWTVTVAAGKVTTETTTPTKLAEFPWILVIGAIVAAAVIVGAVFAMKKRKPKA